MSIKEYAYIQRAIDGKFDIVSLHSGKIVDSLSDISHLKFSGNVINLKDNGYAEGKD